MDTMPMLRLTLLTLAATASCARAPVNDWPAAPNPNGCYVMVFEQPAFVGIRDVWNGPGRWPTLDGLRRTRREGWSDQIRSLRVGPGATITAFTNTDFKGDSRQFAANTDHPQLDSAVSGRIESLQVTCEMTPPT
jgi:hypothetical protein